MNNNYSFKNIIKELIDEQKSYIKMIGDTDLNKCKCKTYIYGYNKNREEYNKYRNKTMEGMNAMLDSQMFGDEDTDNICEAIHLDKDSETRYDPDKNLKGDSSTLWMADQMKFFKQTCDFLEQYMDGDNMDSVILNNNND